VDRRGRRRKLVDQRFPDDFWPAGEVVTRRDKSAAIGLFPRRKCLALIESVFLCFDFAVFRCVAFGVSLGYTIAGRRSGFCCPTFRNQKLRALESFSPSICFNLSYFNTCLYSLHVRVVSSRNAGLS